MNRPGREPDDWDDPALAEAYAEIVGRGVVYRALAEAAVEALDPAPGATVLDLAAGTGVVTGLLLARVGRHGRVAALDRARAMLAVLAAHHPVGNVGPIVADPAALPLARRSLDGAVCSAAFWHFPALARTFAGLARALRPGARLVVNVPAAQLDDVDDLPPPPLMLALEREGRRRFGGAPEPAGPVLSRARLSALAGEAGFAGETVRVVEPRPSQHELARLAELPAFSARLWPGRPERERTAVVRAALAAVEPELRAPVRWLVLSWMTPPAVDA
ncbi:MAG: hypothetical protein Kow0062_18350 [Acidobacteriota bacterium]